MEPFGQLFVGSIFILRRHIPVQSIDMVGDGLVFAETDILDRFAYQIAGLETDDLVGSIFHDPIDDLRPHVLDPLQHRLIALVVAIEIVDLVPVQLVDAQSLFYHIDDVRIGDILNVGINLAPSD